MKTVALVFPNQLFEVTPFKDLKRELFIVEEFLFFNHYKFHKQKIAFHRATMKSYSSHLSSLGYNVTYIDATSKFSDVRKVISNEIFDLPNTYKYDKEFTKAIKTKPMKILNQEDWLDFDNIKNELEVFALAKSPGLRLLNAPLKLNEFDTKKLESFFNLI